jgi:putative tryptophan/tyrosine transport system substrate-binding protein
MERQRPDAVIVQPSLPIDRVAELALSYRIPSASPQSTFVYVGGLMSYHAVEPDLYRRAAVLVDKILKGGEARRASDRAADQVPAGDQSQDRQGARS